MQSSVFGLRHNEQIRWVIIRLIPIYMMDNFSGQQWSTKYLFRYDTMFVSTQHLCIAMCGVGVLSVLTSFESGGD